MARSKRVLSHIGAAQKGLIKVSPAQRIYRIAGNFRMVQIFA